MFHGAQGVKAVIKFFWICILFVDVDNTTTNSQQISKPEINNEENVEENVDPKSPQNETPPEDKGTEQKENSSKVASESDVSSLMLFSVTSILCINDLDVRAGGMAPPVDFFKRVPLFKRVSLVRISKELLENM